MGIGLTAEGSDPVAVLGGGWAGLAAAVELARAGVPVTVYEAAGELGGRARRVVRDGLALDNGQHILLGAYRETLRLIRLVSGEAAPAKLLRLPLELRMQGGLRLAAARLPAPLHLLAGLLRAEGLPLAERVDAVRFMAVQRLRGFRLNKDETVASLLERTRQGPVACRQLWEPLCLAALNTPPERASARVFLAVLRDGLAGDRAASELVLPRSDLSALFPDAAAEFIRSRDGELRTGVRITGLARTAGGFALSAGSERFGARRVVCALPPFRVADLLGNLPELAPAVRAARRLEHLPICTVYLRYPGRLTLPGPITGLLDGPGQWVFDRERLSGQAGVAAVVISGPGAHQRMDHGGLAGAVHLQLAAAFGFAGQPLWHQVITEKRAAFACLPDLDRPPQRTPVQGFVLAGDYTAGEYPATLEGAVRSGVECARLLIGEG